MVSSSLFPCFCGTGKLDVQEPEHPSDTEPLPTTHCSKRSLNTKALEENEMYETLHNLWQRCNRAHYSSPPLTSVVLNLSHGVRAVQGRSADQSKINQSLLAAKQWPQWPQGQVQARVETRRTRPRYKTQFKRGSRKTGNSSNPERYGRQTGSDFRHRQQENKGIQTKTCRKKACSIHRGKNKLATNWNSQPAEEHEGSR